MNKIVLNANTFLNDITIETDSYVIICEDVRAKELNLNIIGCKVIIIDNSKLNNKNLNIVNGEGMVVEIVNNQRGMLNVNNENSSVEYNIIDLSSEKIDYKVDVTAGSENSVNVINIASVSYSDVAKYYKVNTSNLVRHSESEINCFGIVSGKSEINYDVTSFIKNGAKKSKVRQNSNILLFDEASKGENNPILIIEENDVKASHGSSIGKIDDDTMFYLCSRGLTKKEATNLICLGKVEYLIKKIDDIQIKESLINEFKERMS